MGGGGGGEDIQVFILGWLGIQWRWNHIMTGPARPRTRNYV